MPSSRAHELTSPETQERAAALLVIPLGATEQHGLLAAAPDDLAAVVAAWLAEA